MLRNHFCLLVQSFLKSTGEERGVEIQFARDLSHAMGPNGLEKERYDRFYEQIADVLSEMRSRRSIVNIGLMLQEAMLRREYVRIFQDDDKVRATALQLLEKNVATLQEALTVAPTGKGKRRQRNSLIVELATTYGYLARQASKAGHPVSAVLKQYRQARGWARKANQADPDNYYPVDVNLWSALDVLDDDRLDLESRAELQADIFDAMERVDEDSLDAAQVVRLQTRRQEASLAFQDAALEENAFARLIEVGSKAGFLLRTRQIVGDTPRQEPIDADVLTCVKKATEFLLSRWDDIKDDSRCLFYLLKLWWIQHTETILFHRERGPLPKTDDLVRGALGIVDAIIICDGVDASPRIRYLAAVFNWKLMNYEDARQIWNLLAQDTDFSCSRRVRKQHILADSSGKPQRFEGQIQWLDHTGRRAHVLVEALRQEIDLFLSDFGIAEPRKGMAVPTFHIAFNFIGPIADPIRFYRA